MANCRKIGSSGLSHFIWHNTYCQYGARLSCVVFSSSRYIQLILINRCGRRPTSFENDI